MQVRFGKLTDHTYRQWQQQTGVTRPEALALPPDTFVETILVDVARDAHEQQGREMTEAEYARARQRGGEIKYGQVLERMTVPEMDAALQALHALPFKADGHAGALLLYRKGIVEGWHTPVPRRDAQAQQTDAKIRALLSQ